MIASQKFRDLAEQTASQAGLNGARIASVTHPVGGIDRAGLIERADEVVEEVIELLTGLNT